VPFGTIFVVPGRLYHPLDAFPAGFWETAMKKFLITLLMIAALSGAVLVTHSSPAAQLRPIRATMLGNILQS